MSRTEENTAKSCLLALTHGADSVEVDAQLSSDGELVVYQNPRTLDGLRIAGQTYAQLRVHGIERLDDLVAQLPGLNNAIPVGINIELKTGYDTEADYFRETAPKIGREAAISQK